MKSDRRGIEFLQEFGPDYCNNPNALPGDVDGLERWLLAAHADGDLALLSRLYARAADLAEDAGDRDRAAFYLTHAYVFALDMGDAAAQAHHRRLRQWGRDVSSGLIEQERPRAGGEGENG